MSPVGLEVPHQASTAVVVMSTHRAALRHATLPWISSDCGSSGSSSSATGPRSTKTSLRLFDHWGTWDGIQLRPRTGCVLQ